MKTAIVIIASALLFLQGCIPTIIASGIYAGVKGNQQKRDFITQYNANNTEREKAGLKSLDFCAELYKANPKWAYSDKTCKDEYPNPKAGSKPKWK